MALEKLQRWWLDKWDRIAAGPGTSVWLKGAGVLLGLYLLGALLVGIYWSWEPGHFNVREVASRQASTSAVPGAHTTAALVTIVETLLDKPGGYLRNDRLPPGVWLDNVPRWEFGVLVQARDLSSALRKSFSRSQSQSTEDKDLIEAEPLLHFDNNSWLLPPTEREYRKALTHLRSYQARLTDTNQPQAEFHPRADNLHDWLGDVSTRLGSLSQRLSASVGKNALAGTLLEGESMSANSRQAEIQTPWMQIDNVFYEARGTAWALVHILRAVEIDFSNTLDKKEALVSLQQIIRELESTQGTIWSPFILNGTEFGLVANHSLVMASYISRANAAIIDLRALLSQG
ncbi:DUF2333 family protein [Marinobacterium rhizophilum]|uniref:DUF2333 family protein n=1 Tax=Marinobacterium rhizophilum TaxID=420402 RepID=UPI0003602AB5